MPSTFFGLWFSFDPRTTPPTTPAAAVSTPVTTAAFDDPLDELFERALEPDCWELPPLDRLLDADGRLLDALVLFGLLRELDALLPELDALLPFEDVLRVLLRDALLFGLDPLELREVVFFLLCDCELVWAISPP